MLSDPGFRELISLPLSASVLQGLSRAGYTIVSEAAGLSDERMASICGVDLDAARTALRVIRRYYDLTCDRPVGLPSCLIEMPTAYDLLMGSESNETGVPCPNAVVSMCRSLDDILGGGFPTMKLTEVCGEPGVGKTQICIQLSLNVQLPHWFGGMDGEAVFVDTEGNFVPRRARQMAEALVEHCRRHLVMTADAVPSELDRDEHCPSVDSLLSGIHYIRATDHVELLAACQRLHQFCESHPKVRLIVVDSIALPFRYDFDDIPQRNRMLVCIAQCLLKVAGHQNAAVVLTNQVTTRMHSKLSDGPSGSTSHLVPALGESWGHVCSVRVFLTRLADSTRHIKLLKHPGRPPATGTYQITVNLTCTLHMVSYILA
ncbi:RAD51-like protein 2 [Paragonimus westermani]|uniref:DNA repair protein RAD51 homolog 3 n=1 Tax=Paragonimus westermani TaxID=34504 RepID=A0A5J4NEP5_9TREM|nr:RAD51-like protein 2 [Paragonimus westermani]